VQEHYKPIITRDFDSARGLVEVLVFEPEPCPDPEHDADPDDPRWRCKFTINYPDETSTKQSSVGIDSTQALLLALSAVKAELKESEHGINWLGNVDLGLTILDLE